MKSWAAPASLFSLAVALGLLEKLDPLTRVKLPAPPALHQALYALGLLGSLEAVWAAAAAYAIYSLLTRRGLPVQLLASLFLAELLDGVLKVAFSICRPLEASCLPYQPLLVDSYSYPSGHASRTFALPLNAEDRRARAALLAYAAAVAVSRVGVEAHYPLDVVGGAALGLASSIAARLVLPRLMARAGAAPGPS